MITMVMVLAFLQIPSALAGDVGDMLMGAEALERNDCRDKTLLDFGAIQAKKADLSGTRVVLGDWREGVLLGALHAVVIIDNHPYNTSEEIAFARDILAASYVMNERIGYFEGLVAETQEAILAMRADDFEGYQGMERACLAMVDQRYAVLYRLFEEADAGILAFGRYELFMRLLEEKADERRTDTVTAGSR